MKKSALWLAALSALLLQACNQHTNTATISISPDAGTTYKLGAVIPAKAIIPADVKADSIVYLVDSVRVLTKTDTLVANIKTDSMVLGSRLITARVYSAGKATEASTNVILMAAKAPEVLSFKIEKEFKHDTACYTEGLEYHDGFLFESAGDYGHSDLRRVDLNTGKVVQQTKLDAKYFGEGIATSGDKILQLTYREGVAFVYDRKTFKLLNTIPYNWGKEGWGACFDGKHILNDDSSNRIYFLNKDTFIPQGFIEVYDDKHDVQQLNELEYIDGKIYANIYQTDTIAVINPQNGAVLQYIDLSSLYPKASRNPNADVLNGIAYDAAGKRLFITGKRWPKLYQVKFFKK